MANKSWCVTVSNVPDCYGSAYFPHHFAYKKDAVACAKRAIQHGADFATVNLIVRGIPQSNYVKFGKIYPQHKDL